MGKDPIETQLHHPSKTSVGLKPTPLQLSHPTPKELQGPSPRLVRPQMPKRFLQEISLKEPPVGFKKRMEGYPGIPPNMGLPGKEDKFLPNQKSPDSTGGPPQFTFTNIIEGL